MIPNRFTGGQEKLLGTLNGLLISLLEDLKSPVHFILEDRVITVAWDADYKISLSSKEKPV
jgi:hypothetical protein